VRLALCVRWSTPRTEAGEVSPAHYLVQQCQQCVSIVSMHVNNASALHSCITHSATLRVLGVLRGGLARPVSRVAHPDHYLVQQCQQCVSIVSMHVNNVSALRACITHSAPLLALGVLRGGEKNPTGLFRGASSSPSSLRNSLRSSSLDHCCCCCAQEDAVHASLLSFCTSFSQLSRYGLATPSSYDSYCAGAPICRQPVLSTL